MEAGYQFKPGIYLVEGASRGAILDTNTGLVYSVNRQACEVCSHRAEDEPFWQTLVSMGLAECSTASHVSSFPSPAESTQLKFIWLEVVTNRCNQRCLHCYTESQPYVESNRVIEADTASQRKTKQSDIRSARQMQHKDWLRVLDEARGLGCRACQFIGGEPFLYQGENGETLLDLAASARDYGYETIEIFTNGTLLTPARIQRIKELGIKVAVSLYSNDPAVHDRITQTQGSHAKTIKALSLLKEVDVATRLEIVVLKSNQETIQSTIAFRDRQGYKGKKPDPVRLIGRGSSQVNQPDDLYLARYGFRLKPDFKASLEKISHNRSGHPCLQGKLVVSENGDILPCIFSRDQVLGNYFDVGRFSEVLSFPELQHAWHLTKDNILVCRDCEYRYVCFDCRMLAESPTRNRRDKHAPNPRCTYQPYLGLWGDGRWILEQNGQPVYDLSLAASIHVARQALE